MTIGKSEGNGVEETKMEGRKCEIRMEYERYNKKSGHMEVKAQDGLEDDGDLDQEQQYALIARKIFTEEGKLDRNVLRINSPYLLDIFRRLIGSYPTVPFDFESPLEMESPFHMLYHYWEELDAHRHSTSDDTARMHLNLLFEFMKVEMGKDKVRCDAIIKKKQVYFDQLWTIFRPGDLQYATIEGHSWLLRLDKTAYEENKTEGKFLEVHCTYTDYDGTDVGDARHVFKVLQKRNFAAHNPSVITALPVFPRRFLERDGSLESRLTERGGRFLVMQGVLVKAYDGLAFYLKDPPYTYWHPSMSNFEGIYLPFTETGRVVLDRKTFREENYQEQVSIRSSASDEDADPLLCPPYVMGYSLARKEWCRFFVDFIREVEWKTDAFESLIMSDNQKLVLQALVSSHAYPTNARDQTQQKGKGLVMLLHGTPGSGKTLTAESAAEVTNKALICTTLGELNRENIPYIFERRLQEILKYATIWKAIVLLDEADVFLEARAEGLGDSSERNALVAVFLHHLEYFSGVVFLTSNRVETFDTAMKSRIHLAIEYSPPGLETRRLIWTHYLSAIPASETDIDVEEDTIMLIRDDLNGREISNAINTARTIARFQKRRLRLEHIETVLQVRRDFDASLNRKKIILAKADSHANPFAISRRTNSLGFYSEEALK